MQLTQYEIIQILRRRKGLNQAELGVVAFGLTPDSARTKIKNIELGRQLPTAEDSRKLAVALDVQPEAIESSPAGGGNGTKENIGSCSMTAETMKLFPGLGEYIEMLNNAVQLGDHDLIGYLAGRLSSLFAVNYKGSAVGRN